MKKVLITGVNGFVGTHLVKYLAQEHPGVEIFGLVLKDVNDVIKKLSVNILQCNILDKDRLKTIISEIRPDAIFHLAAQSYVSTSWENPEKTLETNIIGQSNLLEAIRAIKDDAFGPVVLIAGSCEEYGTIAEDENPVSENNPLRPLSPYAISKVAQDFMGYQYYTNYGLKIIRIRAFQHTGPGRPPVFGISNFAKQVAEIEAGKKEPEIRVRDDSAVRDFSDVRDVVRAYWLAVNQCQPGHVYNVCSGKGTSIKDILEKLISISKVKDIKIVRDEKDRRPTDGGVMIGDNGKFIAATRWRPEIDFLDETVPSILDYWRKQM
ncbi:MAG: GDP-mannose 4,6-dehydratase [Candidatus Buchananbacteria bacterium CG10_big_fil_rev_8_21_14_0_10_42_9]|uniref:GDP-mannose 4,6-dehydratase n=1 Tax=Candidatus Buchananbacteria bacterium CG10_big_fil_rev_8_21_14_0_10_42_9 TaxID=1974526 RepID=A0A2H0W0F2_9BACT|nr:MAG: GDP-mannose 4,6-dehydratase [Candidatus Buchananbacteria bacterium CG10_big_fil_rev_8_21_14_0_10_42_9]